jgi:hypothetical protein
MSLMKTAALLLFVLWPVSFAHAGDRGRILVDCNWIGGYLHGTAVLRDKGTGETALVRRVEALADAEKWPDSLKHHLANRIHMMFADLRDTSPYALSADYVYNCTASAGDIPENRPDEAGALAGVTTGR